MGIHFIFRTYAEKEIRSFPFASENIDLYRSFTRGHESKNFHISVSVCLLFQVREEFRAEQEKSPQKLYGEITNIGTLSG